MKKPGLFAASVAAASAVSGSSSATLKASREEGGSKVNAGNSSGQEQFAPRFDGLRFIETLITAHR